MPNSIDESKIDRLDCPFSSENAEKNLLLNRSILFDRQNQRHADQPSSFFPQPIDLFLQTERFRLLCKSVFAECQTNSIEIFRRFSVIPCPMVNWWISWGNHRRVVSSIGRKEILFDSFQIELERVNVSSILFQLDDYQNKVNLFLLFTIEFKQSFPLRSFQLERYALFEQGLHDIYQIAQLLRTNSCYIQDSDSAETESKPPTSAESLSGNVVRFHLANFNSKDGGTSMILFVH